MFHWLKRNLHFKYLCAAILLIVAQTLFIVHEISESDHPLSEHCVLCFHGSNLSHTAPPPAVLFTPIIPVVQFEFGEFERQLISASSFLPHARGPPVSFLI